MSTRPNAKETAVDRRRPDRPANSVIRSFRLGLLSALCALLAPVCALAQNTTAGNLTVQQTVKLTGDLTPAQLTAQADDYSPTGLATAAVLRLSSDASRTITGLAGGADGRVLFLLNVGSSDIVLAHESASSTAANRFSLGSGVTLTGGGAGLLVVYDATASRWRALGGTGSGGGGGGSGTVTSVGLSLPAIFSVSGSPVTSSGTLTASLATQSANLVWAGPGTGSAAAPTFRSLVANDIPSLTLAKISDAGALAALSTVNNAQWSGTDLAVANGGTGASTAADARTNLGLVPGTDVQAYDADLAALAALTSAADRLPYFTGSGTAALATFTAAGRALVDDADAAAQRTTLGLAIGTNVQAYDADLTTWAGLTPSANAQSLVTAVNYAAMRALLDLEPGTDFLAYPTGTPNGSKFLRDDNTWQAIPGGGDLLAANNLSDLANAATARTNLGLAIGTNVQAYDADLTTWAGLTPSANAQSLVTAANYAAMRALLDLEPGTDVEAFITAGTTGQYWRGDKSWQTLDAAAVGLGNVTNHAQTQAAVVPNTAPSAGQILVGNAGGTAYAPVAMSGDVALSSTGAATIQANSVALGTDTTGDYIATLTGDSEITVSGAGTEGRAATLAIASSIARAADQSGSHASPSSTNPLAPTWSGVMHTVWYGATGEIDLPAASGYSGKGILIYNTGAFTITIDPNGSEVIVRDGTVQTGGVSMTLSSGAGNYVALLCDGTRWVTLGYKGTLAAGS